MNPKYRRATISVVIAVGAALGVWALASAAVQLRLDRQLAARQSVPPASPLFVSPVALGDTIADRELGQPDFLHNSANFVGPQSLSLYSTSIPGVAIDQSSIPNHLYVADPVNNRVLGWASVAALVNGKGADIVIGQPDFFSSSSNYNGITASSLSAPSGIAVDSSGNLYVADQGNNRVLEYNTPFVVTGEAGSGDNIADEVFGQFDNFTNGGCHLGAGGLCAPSGVALDDMGDLYIADYGNNRVLEYSFPSITTTANLVFGQGGSFTTNITGLSKTGLSSPIDVALDSAGDLYVADYGNSRVLEYKSPLTTDTTADLVFGQGGSFTTGGCNSLGTNAVSLCNPTGVALDGSDRLYIVDQYNHRVLEYNTPLTSATANTVFGQGGNFTTNNPNFDGVVDANGLDYPGHAALDTVGDLFVSDTANNRVLKYNTPLTTDSTTADVVLGQPDFSHNAANEIDGSALSSPNWVAVDNSVSPPRLYVADTSNNRVLGFNNATAFANGAPANIVIGQPDFFSGAPNQSTSASGTTLYNPEGVAVDIHGNLYVADYQNSRVLEYNAPVTSGEAAHLVFGQPNVSTTGCNSSGTINASSLCNPQGVAVDSSGNLYVADYSNNRVLKYNTPLTTDTIADKVLGQSSFAANSCNRGVTLNASTLCNPEGVAVDAASNVYVADYGNSRVLQYLAPIANGQSAHLVFGAPNFTNPGSTYALSATSLSNPYGVALDSADNLYVGDTYDNRILEFNAPLSTNESAHLVFGQGGSFITASPNLGATRPNAETLYNPVGVALDSAKNLYAADTGNNRVLQYLAPLTAPTPTPTPAPSLSITPASVPFGSVATGNTSLPQVVTVKNTGTSAVVINAVDRIGTNPNDFSQNNSCIGSLAPGASCTINVTFTPSATTGTAESASLELYDNAKNAPQLVALSGTSAVAATASPASVNFNNVAVHNTSLAKVVTLTNNQNAALTITGIAIGGTNPGDFAKTTTCGATIPAFGNCTVSLTFTPAALGARSATLSFSDNGKNTPQTVALTGTGAAQATVLPTGLTFATTVVGVTSAAQAVTVTNNQSTALTITGITLGGTNPGDFAKTTTCGATVAAFGTCTVSVTFTPTALGARSATVTVADSPDSASPHVVTLSGTGSAQVTVSPSSLPFASQTVGTQSAAQTVTITNNESGALTIGTISLIGTNPGDFTQASLCPSSLAAHANCSIFVAFKPTATGARSAQLSIADSPDISSPHIVSLTGTGS